MLINNNGNYKTFIDKLFGFLSHSFIQRIIYLSFCFLLCFLLIHLIEHFIQGLIIEFLIHLFICFSYVYIYIFLIFMNSGHYTDGHVWRVQVRGQGAHGPRPGGKYRGGRGSILRDHWPSHPRGHHRGDYPAGDQRRDRRCSGQ